MKRITKFNVQLVRESSKNYEINNIIDSSEKARREIPKILDCSQWHNEKFGIVCLDSQNRIIGYHIITEGTINETHIYNREVILRALLNNATSVILFHNHPSGTLTPSHGDVKATENLKKALDNVQIKLLDHLILTDRQTVSLCEKGLISI